MSRVILLLRPFTRKTTQAWTNFTNYLNRYFGFQYIESIDSLNKWHDKQIDILLIPYSFYSVENILQKANFIAHHTESKIVRFYNEYNLSENSTIRNLIRDDEDIKKT